LKLVNLGLFGLQLVEHVLGQLLGIVLADTTVFSVAQETAEVKRLFPDLSNRQIGSL
jgi:hypothetical protein